MLKPVIMFRIFIFGLFALIVSSVASAYAASNTIAPSNIGVQSGAIPDPSCVSANQDGKSHDASVTSTTNENGLSLDGSVNDIIVSRNISCTTETAVDEGMKLGKWPTDVCVGSKINVASLNCEIRIH